MSSSFFPLSRKDIFEPSIIWWSRFVILLFVFFRCPLEEWLIGPQIIWIQPVAAAVHSRHSEKWLLIEDRNWPLITWLASLRKAIFSLLLSCQRHQSAFSDSFLFKKGNDSGLLGNAGVYSNTARLTLKSVKYLLDEYVNFRVRTYPPLVITEYSNLYFRLHPSHMQTIIVCTWYIYIYPRKRTPPVVGFHSRQKSLHGCE